MRRYLSILRYAKPHWRGWLAIVALTFAFVGIALLQPWPMKVLVDHVLAPVPSAPPSAVSALPGAESAGGIVAWMALATLLVFGLTSALDLLLTTVLIRVGQGMVYDLAADLFARIQRRSLVFHARQPVGDSMSRVTGDSWCVNGLVDSLIVTPLQCIVYVVGVGVVMARLDGTMTLIAFVTAPGIAAVSYVVGRRLRPLGRARRESESRIQSHVQQTLTGIHVVQAFGQEQREHERFQSLAADVIRTKRRSVVITNVAGLVTGLLLSLGTGAVLLIGGSRVLEGHVTLGTLLVFLAYLTGLQDRFRRMTAIYTTLQATRGQVDRVAEVLEAEPEVRERSAAQALGDVRGDVRLEDVTFGYEPDRPILSGVSLQVSPGQTLAIVGATGAGKSTLAGLIPRFFDPWKGRVLLDGRDVRDLCLRELRENVALVLQEPFLHSGSIASNIAYGRPEATKAEIEAAARTANADAFVRALPEGYETLVGQRGQTLSGGERQRLAIARALLKDAPVLVLDEPTSALDSATEALLVEALGRLMRGRTTIIIAHRLSTIRGADRIVVVDSGRIIESGAHAELLRADGAYARFHRIQTGSSSSAPIASDPPTPGAAR